MRQLNTNEWIAVALGVGVVLLFFFVFGGNMFSQSSGNGEAALESKLRNSADEMENAEILKSPDAKGLVKEDIIEGKGDLAEVGDRVSVHYTGTLQDGSVFDSSHNRGVPFEFALGAGEVIEGWDLGVVGMRVGGQRMLVIPPELAYGGASVGGIPANSTLIFEVELLEVKK